MKFKILILTTTLFIISASLFAKPVIDSVGVKNQDGKKVILFKVKPKDTYYSIGRRFNVSPKAIMKYNGSKKETLTIGAIVKVPTDIPYKKSHKEKETSEKVVKETKKEKKERLAREAKEAKADKKHKHKYTEEQTQAATEQAEPEQVQPAAPVKQQPAPAKEENAPALQYKVSAGETLYGIAKRFNTSVDYLMKLNNLKSTTLSPGQVLNVKPGSEAPQPAVVQNTDTQAVVKHDSIIRAPNSDSSDADHHLNANRFGLYEKNEKGVATWIDDTSLDPNKKLVLHRTAPIGTVIKITNPMTNRTTFAKVVGRFTDNESTKDVIIVMTKNVADSLGALDKRFHVLISYGSPNE